MKNIHYLIGVVFCCVSLSCVYIPSDKDGKSHHEESETKGVSSDNHDAWRLDKTKDQTSDRRARVSRLLKVDVKPAPHLEDQAGNSYHPSNLIDNDFTNAWAVDLNQPGVIDADVLDCLVFHIGASRIDHVVFANGYGKSDKAFRDNTRAKYVKITRVPWEEAEEGDIIYEGTLADTKDPQMLNVNPAYDNSRPTNTVYVCFSNDFYRGRKYNDLCVSEIQFYGQ